jgi:large subunit ribosomal protein L10
LPTPQKEMTVQGLVETLGRSQAAIVADYRGLTVEQLASLRKRLRPARARFVVVKNTLLKIALREKQMPSMDELLEGPNAILFIEGDPVDATKVLTAYVKELRKNLPQIKGGLLGTRLMSAKDVDALAALPPREQILATLVGTVQTPVANVVSTLGAILQNLVGTIESYHNEKSGAAA